MDTVCWLRPTSNASSSWLIPPRYERTSRNTAPKSCRSVFELCLGLWVIGLDRFLTYRARMHGTGTRCRDDQRFAHFAEGLMPDAGAPLPGSDEDQL